MPDPRHDDLLIRHVMGELLSAAEQAELDDALSRDPHLRAELDSLRETTGQLALSASMKPPAALRARVLAAALPAAGRSYVPLALAAGFATLMSATSLMLWWENQALRLDNEQQAAAAQMLLEPNVVKSYELRGSGAGAGSTALVMLDLDAQRASISGRNLPPLPPGQAYYLWAELEGSNVPCGRFTVQPDGSVLTQFRIPVNAYVSPILRLYLTVETGGEVSAPAGATVMSS